MPDPFTLDPKVEEMLDRAAATTELLTTQLVALNLEVANLMPEEPNDQQLDDYEEAVHTTSALRQVRRSLWRLRTMLTDLTKEEHDVS